MAQSKATRIAKRIKEAQEVLRQLGMPKAQTNERSGRVLLALLNLEPGTIWGKAINEEKGVWPIIQWIAANLDITYAVGSRETIRKATLHQFVAAGLAIVNGDDASRSTNSSKYSYHISTEALEVLRAWGSPYWDARLAAFKQQQPGLIEAYARRRRMELVPVLTPAGDHISLSPGGHSELIRAIIEKFAPRFVPGARIIYVGDTGDKHAIFDAEYLAALGVVVDKNGKLPDVILHSTEKNWLVLAEACSNVGPLDGKRYAELTKLFANATPGLVFVSGFPDRKTMRKFSADVAWETECWIAEVPDHLVHFNGERFLGPYEK